MSTPPEQQRAYEAGIEAGRVAQLLLEHEHHFITLNGSMAHNADAINNLAQELRGIREDMRLAAERTNINAQSLVIEANRKQEELMNRDRKLTHREKWFASITTIVLAVAGYLVGK